MGTASANQAVQAAFIQSLEAQLAAMRRDLTEQYKIQATNAQRLLIMTDQLRQAEDRNRTDAEELRKVTNEVEGLRERAKWHQQVVAEKERQILVSLSVEWIDQSLWKLTGVLCPCLSRSCKTITLLSI